MSLLVVQLGAVTSRGKGISSSYDDTRPHSRKKVLDLSRISRTLRYSTGYTYPRQSSTFTFVTHTPVPPFAGEDRVGASRANSRNS